MIKRLENQAKAAEKYNLLKQDKAKLELDKAVLFSIEAKNSRDDLQKKLDAHNRDLKIKNTERDTIQSQIDQYRTENDSVLGEYEIAQKNFYAVGAEIAKREANLQNINKSESETKYNLQKAKQNYEKAKETEKNFDELSPSEKAMHILDNIILTLEKFGIDKDNIQNKAQELKKLLVDILNIATAQSKSLTGEYLSRQNELEGQIEEAEKLKNSIELEMKEFVEKSSDAESVLIKLRQRQSKFNEDLRELENKKSISDLDSRAISEKITNVRIELKTYEINLENSNKKIKDIFKLKLIYPTYEEGLKVNV